MEMSKKEMIQIAITAIDKNMTYEQLKYSDDLYGREHMVEEVWDYVIEAQEQGMIWFMKTYGDTLK